MEKILFPAQLEETSFDDDHNELVSHSVPVTIYDYCCKDIKIDCYSCNAGDFPYLQSQSFLYGPVSLKRKVLPKSPYFRYGCLLLSFPFSYLTMFRNFQMMRGHIHVLLKFHSLLIPNVGTPSPKLTYLGCNQILHKHFVFTSVKKKHDTN